MLREICIFVVFVSMVAGMPQGPNQSRPPFQNRPPISNPPPYSNKPPLSDYARSQILRSENENTGTGNFHWGYENDDQQSHRAEGRFEKAFDGHPDKALGVTGSWSYVDADNKKVLVEYTAGINGYRETRKFVN